MVERQSEVSLIVGRPVGLRKSPVWWDRGQQLRGIHARRLKLRLGIFLRRVEGQGEDKVHHVVGGQEQDDFFVLDINRQDLLVEGVAEQGLLGLSVDGLKLHGAVDQTLIDQEAREVV